MDVEQLTGKYSQLRDELANLYSASEWQSAQIDDVTAQIAATERALAAYGARLESGAVAGQ